MLRVSALCDNIGCECPDYGDFGIAPDFKNIAAADDELTHQENGNAGVDLRR